MPPTLVPGPTPGQRSRRPAEHGTVVRRLAGELPRPAHAPDGWFIFYLLTGATPRYLQTAS
jgi:hypothetical protein